jgi:arabinose-5-phosphate isomerase
MDAEGRAILDARTKLGGAIRIAITVLFTCGAKTVVTGIGKSGLIGRKIAATLCSTGTPAAFMHPVEALHGDLGMCAPGDPVIMLSKSGSTPELLALVPLLKQSGSKIIGILGSTESQLGRVLDVVLDASVSREADPLDIAPTSSAVVALAIGDALASALMVSRGFTLEDYGRSHPGGQLGRSLLLAVQDVMHTGSRVAWVAPGSTLKEVVVMMTEHPLGAACVVDEARRLLGLITDGDLRRVLRRVDDIRSLSAADAMTPEPTTIAPQVRLREALELMENRPSQIGVLPVVDTQGVCVGLVRVHDMYGRP